MALEIAPAVSEILGLLITNLDALGYEVVGSQYETNRLAISMWTFWGMGVDFALFAIVANS